MSGRSAARARRWTSRWLLLAVLAALGATARPAAAQSGQDITQLSLEDLMALEVDVVYGASRYEQKVTEAPASVTIVTGSQIRDHGYRTLADVLAAAAGFYISDDRNYSYVGVRGFARPGDFNSRVLLMIDGHRLNDNIYDQAALGTDCPIDLALVDRVEIIRGPNSALYGTSAFLAVVNLVTKDARKMDGISASGAVGSLGLRDGQVAFGAVTPGSLRLRLAASHQGTTGQRRIYYPEYASPDSDGVAVRADGDAVTRVFASAAYGGLTVTGSYGSRRKHVPTAAYGVLFNDPRFWTQDDRGYVDGQYERRVKGMSVFGRAYLDSYRYTGSYPYPREAGDGTWINDDLARGLWWGAEGRLTSPAGRPHRASVGFEYVGHLKRDQRTDDETGYYYLDDHRTGRDWALYAQDHFRALDQLAFSASLRYDRKANLRETFSPRVAVIYDPIRATTVKAVFGRVFRFPNAYESYYADGTNAKRNPDLGPETVNTYELMVDRRLGERLRLAVGSYASRIHDLVELREDPQDGLAMFDNVLAVAADGMEVEAEAKDGRGTPLARASYSFERARQSRTGAPLSNSPRHLVKLNVIAPLDAVKATVAGELQYASRRLTLAGAQTRPVWLANVNLVKHDVAPGLDLSLAVRNLLDYRYADPGAVEHRQDMISRDGRTFEVRFTFSPRK